MQYISISKTTTLSDLNKIAGTSNTEQILNANQLKRSPNIGQQFIKMCDKLIEDVADVDWQRKLQLLNKFTEDSEIFEIVSLLGETGWKLLSKSNLLPNLLKIPDTITLPDSDNIVGNGVHVDDLVYRKVTTQIQTPPHIVDPSAFNKYMYDVPVTKSSTYPTVTADAFSWFKIPWGEVTLYSSISEEAIDFPVYPEEVTDSVVANYTQMQELLYQYEPWPIYTSSGPTTKSYKFDFHRQMWSGNHNDGLANRLVRFCQSNCYAHYRGTAVDTPTVTLYIHGGIAISGIMLNVDPEWYGPLADDGFFLGCRLTITIQEVSPIPLDYTTVKERPLLGY